MSYHRLVNINLNVESYIDQLNITQMELKEMSSPKKEELLIQIETASAPDTHPNEEHDEEEEEFQLRRPSSEPLLVQNSMEFQNQIPSLVPTPHSANYSLPPSHTPVNTQEFMAILNSVREATQKGILPQRIVQGSSGSYFCKNTNNEIVAVFKPKNEEPYGHLNPKWTKWLHKTCCPCCFGRSCLIPNTGYISEAAASIVDRHLGFYIVPRTEIVSLSSQSFSYSYLDKQHAKKNQNQFPPKIGSFQLFMGGFMNATQFLREGPLMLKDGRLPRDEASGRLLPSLQKQFQLEFEKMVILDFIIRNTDRGLDNWLIRCSEPKQSSSISGEEDMIMVSHPKISIAAIDHGLAFPFKHPDQWRSYPYGWTALPAAHVPFSQEIRRHCLSLFSSQSWLLSLLQDMKKVMQVDKDFDEKMFKRQMAVLRGQIYVLIQILKKGLDDEVVVPKSPLEAPQHLKTFTFQQVHEQPVAQSETGTPFDLTLHQSCLIWDDEDVNEMVKGGFGTDWIYRDGLLGHIIGGVESVMHPAGEQKDVNEGQFLTTDQAVEPSSSSSAQGINSNQQRGKFKQTKQKVSDHLDAFKGRVVTFVKSQAWFKNW